MTMTLTDECIHGLDGRTCAICRKAAGYLPGTDRHDNDCTVQAFQTLTGASYEEALDFLAAAGRRPGRGATREQVRDAFRSAGFETIPYAGTLHDAQLASERGEMFLAVGRRGSRAHAWSIEGGAHHNTAGYIRPGTRYLIWRVV